MQNWYVRVNVPATVAAEGDDDEICFDQLLTFGPVVRVCGCSFEGPTGKIIRFHSDRTDYIRAIQWGVCSLLLG